MLVAFSLFDHRHLPPKTDPTYKEHGKDKLLCLGEQYGVESEVNQNSGVITLSPDIDTELIQEEWTTYRRLLYTQTGDMQERITEVLQSLVYRQLFPNLVKLMSILLCLPVSTASVERSFSAMKTIKTRLRNRLTDTNLSNLMKIAIEGPCELNDCDLEQIVDMWNTFKARAVCV